MPRTYAKPAKGVYRQRVRWQRYRQKWVGTAVAVVVSGTRRRKAMII